MLGLFSAPRGCALSYWTHVLKLQSIVLPHPLQTGARHCAKNNRKTFYSGSLSNTLSDRYQRSASFDTHHVTGGIQLNKMPPLNCPLHCMGGSYWGSVWLRLEGFFTPALTKPGSAWTSSSFKISALPCRDRKSLVHEAMQSRGDYSAEPVNRSLLQERWQQFFIKFNRQHPTVRWQIQLFPGLLQQQSCLQIFLIQKLEMALCLFPHFSRNKKKVVSSGSPIREEDGAINPPGIPIFLQESIICL